MDSVIVTSDSLFEPPSHWVLVAPINAVDIPSKQQLLSKEELERAARFRKSDDRQRYSLAHALKRYCLARYLNVAASALEFSVGAKGKPYCTHKDAPAFNLSHSGDYVLMGLSGIGHIGVDVERFNRDVSADIYPKVLTAEQQAQVMASPEPHYEFMCYWTQKEAISKALGLGLAIDFTTIECSGVEGEFDTHHSKQRLLVSTRQWDQAHIVSVASTVKTPLQVLALTAWDNDLLIENQNVQTASLA